MPGQDRDAMRRFFFNAWRKHQRQAPLEPMEEIMARIIAWHPEYHGLFDNEESLRHDFPGDSNPFLHLSLHLAVQEQLTTQRPAGLAECYRQLAAGGDEHGAEHAIMECLAELLQQSRMNPSMEDEARYLECVRGKLK